MKDGNTQQRSKEAKLCITCRETLTGGSFKGVLRHRLSLSYEMLGDKEPLHDTPCVRNYSNETQDYAAKFTNSLRDDEYDTVYLSEEVTIGSALVSLVCRGTSNACMLISKMKSVAESMGFEFKHIKVIDECIVACSVTPTILSDSSSDEPGYKISMSYTCGNGNRPLSLDCNRNFIDKITYEFGYAFTSVLRGSDFYSMDTSQKRFLWYDLMSFECHHADLEDVIKQLNAAARVLDCKLTFVAFSGRPRFAYPHVDLCDYQIK